MNIGVLGLGTVGGGVVNVLNKNKTTILARTGQTINIIQAAVKSLDEERICNNEDFDITEDAFAVVNHPKIDVILELIGGTSIAKDLVERALNQGKHVITANKALIATHGSSLLALAKSKNVHLLFEAAVAGGIPILKALGQGLSGGKCVRSTRSPSASMPQLTSTAKVTSVTSTTSSKAFASNAH